MARTLDDIRNERKELEQISNFRRKDGEINLKYRQRHNDLVKEELDLKKELNRQYKLGTDSQKASAKFAQEAKKAEEDLNKSWAVRLQHIAKGNILQGLSWDFSKKARKAQKDLADEASRQSQNILENDKLSSSQKLGLLNLNRDIVDGLVDEGEEQARLYQLGLGNDDDRIDAASTLTDLKKDQLEKEKEGATWMKKSAMLGGIAAIAIGAMWKAMSQFAAKIDDVGKTFGFLTSKASAWRNDLIVSGNVAGTIGKNLSDVLSVTSDLSSEFGIGLVSAGKLSVKVLDTAVATGLSNDEATKLFGTFIQIGDLTAKQAEYLIESTAQLAAQRGVAPQAVLKDMAGSAEEIAKFTKDGGSNIADAAIQARQMGLSLQTTAKIAEGLLDFESSITNEIEASVLIGRQLNFQRARQLALEGDIAGATKDIVSQLGSEDELNRLNVIQRQAIAKSIGVSVAELSKMVSGADKLTLSTALAGQKFDDLVGQDSLSMLTNIVNAIKAIGASLLDTFGGPVNAFLERFRKDFAGPEGVKKLQGIVESIGRVMVKLMNAVVGAANIFLFGDNELDTLDANKIFGTPATVNDFRASPGQITYLMGSRGVMRVNPRDTIMGTTRQVNDFSSGPANSLPGTDPKAIGEAIANNLYFKTTVDTGRFSVVLDNTQDPLAGPALV
jgi:uncharacterized protein YktB (UPF0637 family)